MTSLLNKLRTEYFSEYSMKKYSKVKIYHGGKDFDLSKRWYVYFNYQHPTIKNMDGTPKMVQQNPIYYKVNKKLDTKSERMAILRELKDVIEQHLKQGWSPYDIEEKIRYTASYSLDFALKIKKTEVKESTYQDYAYRVKMFKDFLGKELFIDSVDQIDKKIVSKFLNTFDGAKNRNNTKAALSSIFTVLSDEDLIPVNFIKEIRNKKTNPKPIRIYTDDEIEAIDNLLIEYDYTLYLFTILVSYMFWRPIEIVRLSVDSVDFENKRMWVETKGKPHKIKIIPDIIFDELYDFCKNKTSFLFMPDGCNVWNLSEVAKRKYFTLRFSRFRKKHKIDPEFKIYSRRHTSITKVYLYLRKTKSKEDTIKELSLITGHESKAIQNYIRVNDIELPDDYSEYLK